MNKNIQNIRKLYLPLLLFLSLFSASCSNDNSKLDRTNILLLGVDQRGQLTDNGEVGKGGQADTILLMSVDNQDKSALVIPISRDSMVEVDRYDTEGNYYDRQVMQLCLQYAYGTSHESSSSLMVNKVSELFDGLAIDGYITANLDIIPLVNDAVGGVTVKLEQDLTYFDPAMKPGTSITLTGEQSIYYLWDRNITNIGNHDRMKRQKQYMKGFLYSFQKAFAKDSALPVRLIAETKDYIKTDMSAAQLTSLASKLISYGTERIELRSIKTQIKDGGEHWEAYLDENDLHTLADELKGTH